MLVQADCLYRYYIGFDRVRLRRADAAVAVAKQRFWGRWLWHGIAAKGLQDSDIIESLVRVVSRCWPLVWVVIARKPLPRAGGGSVAMTCFAPHQPLFLMTCDILGGNTICNVLAAG